MFGSRKLVPLLVMAALGTFGATAASAHGPGHGHGHGHFGHGHFGHGHGHWGHGHGHGHFGGWGYSTVLYGGHCHTRRWINPFGEVVLRRVCH